MKTKIKTQLTKIFEDYKSVNQMLKGNTMIIKRVGYEKIPELSIAFCKGVVFEEVASLVHAHSYPEEPAAETMEEAITMYLGFLRGDYEN